MHGRRFRSIPEDAEVVAFPLATLLVLLVLSVVLGAPPVH